MVLQIDHDIKDGLELITAILACEIEDAIRGKLNTVKPILQSARLAVRHPIAYSVALIEKRFYADEIYERYTEFLL